MIEYQDALRLAREVVDIPAGPHADTKTLARAFIGLLEQYENERQANVALSGDVTRLSEQYAALEAENDRYRSQNRDFKVTVDALSDKLARTIEQYQAALDALREACLHQGLPEDAPPDRIAAHFASRNSRLLRTFPGSNPAEKSHEN